MGRVRRTVRWLAAGSLALLGGMLVPFGGGLVSAQGASACEDRPGLVTWDGDAGTSAWSEPTNWSGDAVPGPGQHACIAMPGASVSIDAGTAASIASIQVELGSALTIAGGASLELTGPEPSTLATLGLFGGTLQGTGTRTLTGSAVLDTGTLTGNGRTELAAGATLSIGTGQGGTLAINGGQVLAIDAGATATWGPGPHDITLDAPSRLEVAGELDITNDRNLAGSGTLAVTGTLRKLSHGTTTLALVPADGSVLGVEGTIEVHAGLLDVTGPGLQLDGVLEVRSTPAETGVLRTTTLALPATGHIRFGIARTAPAATAGFVIVTGAAPELAGALDLMPDPSLAVAADQRLTLVSTTAEPTGDPTITGADTLPGSGSRVKVGSGGVTLELVAARG